MIRRDASQMALASRGPSGSGAVVYALIHKYSAAALFCLETKTVLLHQGVANQVSYAFYFTEDRWLYHRDIMCPR